MDLRYVRLKQRLESIVLAQHLQLTDKTGDPESSRKLDKIAEQVNNRFGAGNQVFFKLV